MANAHKTASLLLEAATRLTSILDEETQHLSKQDVASIVPLQDDKNKLLKVYEASISEMQRKPTLIEALNASEKVMLSEALKKLQNTTTTNRRALMAARDSRRFVLNAIRDAAMESIEQHTAYTAKGNSTGAFYGRGQAAVSVAMDQRL